MTRRGFTLIELMVAMVVLAVLGTALARLLLSNSRFVAQQEAHLEARQTARAAMNLIAAEVRAVTDGGITVSGAAGFGFRMPVGFGMLCGTVGASTIGSLAPVDSVVFHSGTVDGVAIRRSNGAYDAVDGVTVSASTATAVCAIDSVRVIPGGRLVALDAAGLGNPGDLFYAYRYVLYAFATSADMPGRIGLWRRESGGPSVEVLAPFSTDAGVRYLVGNDLHAEASPPLSSVRGVELRIVAESETTPPGLQAPVRFALQPRIAFVNRSN